MDDMQASDGVRKCTTLGVTFRPPTVTFHSTQQKRLIIYAYYRSGSTLAGHAFNSNPNAFYWSEPLAGVTTQFGAGDGSVHPRNFFHFDNGTDKYVKRGCLFEIRQLKLRTATLGSVMPAVWPQVVNKGSGTFTEYHILHIVIHYHHHLQISTAPAPLKFLYFTKSWYQ